MRLRPPTRAAFLGLVVLLYPLSTWGNIPFSRGDFNADAKVDVSDPVAILLHLFVGAGTPPCFKAGDVNDDGALNVTDPVVLLHFLFLEGLPPPKPFAECGIDGTPDGLGCNHFFPCSGGDAIVKEDVRFLDSERVSLTHREDGSVVLAGEVKALELGQVLVSDQGRGFLGRAESITREADSWVVETSPVFLDDVYEEAQVELRKTLGPEDIESIEPLREGVSVEYPGEAGALGDRAQIEEKTCLRLDLADSALPVSVKGAVCFILGLDFELDVRQRKFFFQPFVTAESSVQVEAAAKLDLFEREWPLARITSTPLVVLVGFVPVVIVPVFDVALTLDGDVKVGFELTRKIHARVAAGMRYTPAAGWELTREFTPEDFGGCPTFFGDISAQTALQWDYEVLLYGVVGAYARLQGPLLDLSVRRTVVPPPGRVDIKLETGARASLGATVSLLGNNLLDQEFPLALDTSVPIYEKNLLEISAAELDLFIGTWRNVGDESLGKRYGAGGAGSRGTFDQNGTYVEITSFQWVISGGVVTETYSGQTLREEVLEIAQTELVQEQQESCLRTHWRRVGCPDGMVQNPETGACVLPCAGGQMYDPENDRCGCPAGTILDVITQECIPECPSGDIYNPVSGGCDEECGAGMIRDPLRGECVPECDEGQIYNAVTGQCQEECPPGKKLDPFSGECEEECPEGQIPDPETGECTEDCPEDQIYNPISLECEVPCERVPDSNCEAEEVPNPNHDFGEPECMDCEEATRAYCNLIGNLATINDACSQEDPDFELVLLCIRWIEELNEEISYLVHAAQCAGCPNFWSREQIEELTSICLGFAPDSP